LSLIGTPLIVALIVTDDHIIRYVCLREGRKYSYLWLFSRYWQRRIFGLRWFTVAREAGYLTPIITLSAAWICTIVAAGALLAGGFVYPSPFLMPR
jgi:hypothetical protein